MVLRYKVGEIVEYINWGYFFHAWGLPFKMSSIANVHRCQACQEGWISNFSDSDTVAARDAVGLYNEAVRFLGQMQAHVEVMATFKLYDAASHDEDIILYDECGLETALLPMLRQQVPGQDGYCLCLADFLPSDDSGKKDKIGLFATSVSDHSPTPSASGSVKLGVSHSGTKHNTNLLLQTLSDRLAEAAAERLHEQARKEPSIWGYATDEQLNISQMHECKYVGIRPAVGYPCIPDLALNFMLDKLLDMKSIGIRLTEHGMMIPHASVSGLMLSNSHARYFTVGEVSDEQAADYKRRKELAASEFQA